MADELIGVWQLVSSENLENYLREMEVPEVMIETVKDVSSELTLSRVDGGWKICTKVEEKAHVVTFLLGQETNTVSILGEPMKVTLTEEGGRLVEKQLTFKGETTIVRFVENGHLITTMTLNGVTASVKFKKI